MCLVLEHHDPDAPVDCLMKGTLREMVAESRKPVQKRKILNALSLPLTTPADAPILDK